MGRFEINYSAERMTLAIHTLMYCLGHTAWVLCECFLIESNPTSCSTAVANWASFYFPKGFFWVYTGSLQCKQRQENKQTKRAGRRVNSRRRRRGRAAEQLDLLTSHPVAVHTQTPLTDWGLQVAPHPPTDQIWLCRRYVWHKLTNGITWLKTSSAPVLRYPGQWRQQEFVFRYWRLEVQKAFLFYFFKL